LKKEAKAADERDLVWALAVGKISAALSQGYTAYAQVKAEKTLSKMCVNPSWLCEQGVGTGAPPGSDSE
jgi:hypothetical protein